MQHLVLIEKSGELPHYRLLNCDKPTLKRQLRQDRGAYKPRDGYRIRVTRPENYTQPLGEKFC